MKTAQRTYEDKLQEVDELVADLKRVQRNYEQLMSEQRRNPTPHHIFGCNSSVPICGFTLDGPERAPTCVVCAELAASGGRCECQ